MRFVSGGTRNFYSCRAQTAVETRARTKLDRPSMISEGAREITMYVARKYLTTVDRTFLGKERKLQKLTSPEKTEREGERKETKIKDSKENSRTENIDTPR